MSFENAISTVNPNAIFNMNYGSQRPTKTPKRRNKSDLGPDFIAPDGGWGWIVCIAAGLSSFSIYPALQLYSSLYADRMHKYETITSLFSVKLIPLILIGVISGAIFRRFPFRQVALAGGIFVFSGIALAAFCRHVIQSSICFFLYGIGFGLNTLATTFAVYTYFYQHRRIATGLVWTIIGSGPVVFPLLSEHLSYAYETDRTILIIAAIALISLVCGIALRPVLHVNSKNIELDNGIYTNLQDRTTEQQNEQIQDQRAEEIIIQRKRTFTQKVVRFFDLDLLSDLTFVNLLQGMTIMKIAANNFDFVTPSTLYRYDYIYFIRNTPPILSLVRVIDIVTRFLAPVVLARVRIGNSTLFAFGIIVILVGRYLLTIVDSYFVILGLYSMIGLGNAFCTVFGQLIIPSNVPLHRLPAALGFQMAFETLLWLTLIPIIEEIIAFFIGYKSTIYFNIIISIFSLSLWGMELVARRRSRKPNSHTQQH